MKTIMAAVKETRKTLNRRGHRPGVLVLVLNDKDGPIIGTSEDATLEDVSNLLEIALLHPAPKTTSEALTNEVSAQVRKLKLPESYLIGFYDVHTNTYVFIPHASHYYATIGKSLLQVGRLMGLLAAKTPSKPHAPTVQATVQPAKPRHPLVRALSRLGLRG